MQNKSSEAITSCKIGERVTVMFQKGDYPFSSWFWFIVDKKEKEQHEKTSLPTSRADEFISAMKAGEAALRKKLVELKCHAFINSMDENNQKPTPSAPSAAVVLSK